MRHAAAGHRHIAAACVDRSAVSGQRCIAFHCAAGNNDSTAIGVDRSAGLRIIILDFRFHRNSDRSRICVDRSAISVLCFVIRHTAVRYSHRSRTDPDRAAISGSRSVFAYTGLYWQVLCFGDRDSSCFRIDRAALFRGILYNLAALIHFNDRVTHKYCTAIFTGSIAADLRIASYTDRTTRETDRASVS